MNDAPVWGEVTEEVAGDREGTWAGEPRTACPPRTSQGLGNDRVQGTKRRRAVVTERTLVARHTRVYLE